MHPNVDRLLGSIALLVLLAGSASGGVLLTDGDGFGIDAALISGKQEFGPTILVTAPQVDIGKLSANVEWAVYAPGAFGSSAALGVPGNAAEPSNGTQYVYAYEIFNGATDTTAIGSFSIGLIDDMITDLTYKGFMTSPGGTPYLKSEFIPVGGGLSDITNVKYTFGSPGAKIPVGGHSDYLLFTSPYGPGLKNSSLVGTGALRARSTTNPGPDGYTLPTPIPEPSTVLLGAIGGLSLLALAGYRRRRRV